VGNSSQSAKSQSSGSGSSSSVTPLSNSWDCSSSDWEEVNFESSSPSPPPQPPSQPSSGDVPPVPPVSPPLTPPAVAPPDDVNNRVIDIDDSVLDGFRLSNRSIMQASINHLVMREFFLTALVVRFLFYWGLSVVNHISVQDCVLKYTDEHRIVTSRNVKETKEDMRVMQLKICALRIRFFWTLHLINYVLFCIIWLYLPFYIALYGWFILTLPVIYMIKKYSEYEETFLPFCPHVITCVLFDFDHPVNNFTFNQNVWSKFRRLSTLPIPDVDHMAIMMGSKLMIEQILQDSQYFWAPAACLPTP
jgi:hypothetical protein